MRDFKRIAGEEIRAFHYRVNSTEIEKLSYGPVLILPTEIYC